MFSSKKRKAKSAKSQSLKHDCEPSVKKSKLSTDINSNSNSAVQKLWVQHQYQIGGTKCRLGPFQALNSFLSSSSSSSSLLPPYSCLYLGSHFHLTPSYFWSPVIYVDNCKSAIQFFQTQNFKIITKIIQENRQKLNTGSKEETAAEFSFINADYTSTGFKKQILKQSKLFDVAISAHAGPVSHYAAPFLKKDGLLLVDDSFKDATLAYHNPSLQLIGFIEDYSSTQVNTDPMTLDSLFKLPSTSKAGQKAYESLTHPSANESIYQALLTKVKSYDPLLKKLKYVSSPVFYVFKKK